MPNDQFIPNEIFGNVYADDVHGLCVFGYRDQKKAARMINSHALAQYRFVCAERVDLTGGNQTPIFEGDFKPLRMRPASDEDYPAKGTGVRLSPKAFARLLKRIERDGEAGPDAISDWLSDHIEHLLDENGKLQGEDD